MEQRSWRVSLSEKLIQEQESAESPERTDYDSSLLSAEKRVKAVFFMIQLMKQQQVPLY